MRYLFIVLLTFGLCVVLSAGEPEEKVGKKEMEETNNPMVLMQTNYGDFVIEVYEKDMPVHGGNFLKLIDEGFYDSLTFHRIVPKFVIQGGDPEGTGMGGAPGKLADEDSPFKHDRATIAMARGREASSTSQFYINLKGNYPLDKQGFDIFAKVIKGMEVVDKITGVETAGPQNSTPVKPVIMTKVARLEAEKEAPKSEAVEESKTAEESEVEESE